MNGPEHYVAGEAQQQRVDALISRGHHDEAAARAALASSHFLAAAVTILAGAYKPNNIPWEQAIG